MPEWNLPPAEIERRSMAIIDHEAGAHGWPDPLWAIVRRMIHTSADFDYAASALIHPRAITSGLAALRRGCRLVTDTRMALAGIAQRRLAPWGASASCLLDHPEAEARATAQGATRSLAGLDLAVEGEQPPEVFVIGNAPTALLRLVEHIQAGRVSPALVVGLPVGFVNAAESKEALARLDTPFITNIGRKGGSNVAASVINALTLLCQETQP